MTATNPHPLANPLNRHRYAAYEMQRMPKAVSRCNDPSKLEVPQSSMTYEQAIERQRSLTVPYSAAGDLPQAVSGSFGFIGDSSLFRLHDGSVLDLKTHRVVLDPSRKFRASGYWDDPCRDIGSMHSVPGCGQWEKAESIESILAGHDAAAGNYDPNLSQYDVKYWTMAREMSKHLEQNMTDEQKKLLAELNAEEFFPMSKLKEE